MVDAGKYSCLVTELGKATENAISGNKGNEGKVVFHAQQGVMNDANRLTMLSTGSIQVDNKPMILDTTAEVNFGHGNEPEGNINTKVEMRPAVGTNGPSNTTTITNQSGHYTSMVTGPEGINKKEAAVRGLALQNMTEKAVVKCLKPSSP